MRKRFITVGDDEETKDGANLLGESSSDLDLRGSRNRSRAGALTHNNSVDVYINEDIIPKRSLAHSRKDSVASLASLNQIDVTKMGNYK